MGRLYIPVIILHLSIVAKTFYCNDNTITEFEIIDSRNSSTSYVILNELIDLCVLDLNRRVEVWSLPWQWHILSILLTAGRGTSAETCGLDDVFAPLTWLLFPSRSSVNMYMYIYIRMHSLYKFCYRTYIYTYTRSVVQYWWNCTSSQSIGLLCGVRGSWFECHFLFSLVYQLCFALW